MEERRSPRPAEDDLSTSPPFVTYGLGDAYAGPGVLERWSRRGSVALEIALGHGLRWSDEPWLEVATLNPALVPEFYPQQVWSRRVRARLESEQDELIGRHLWDRRVEQPVDHTHVARVKVSGGEHLEFPLQHLGPLSCGATMSSEGALIIMTWVGRWHSDDLELQRIQLLEPYIQGLERDRQRRA